MLSRIFWVVLTGIALVAGAAMQGYFGFGRADSDEAREAVIEERVERAVEGRLARVEVVRADGRMIEASQHTKEELGHAVSRLVKAETNLALARIRNDGDAAVQDARARRDAARADVDRLKSQIEREEQLSRADRDALRTQIRQEVRETVREAIRG